MSAIITGKVFWTPFKELSYQDKNGKTIKIKETTAKIVMLAIADSADDYGENSWQSFETIATKASIERRSVIRVVRALLSHKYLSIAGITQYGTNNFSINKDLLGCPPAKRSKAGRPKTSDSETQASDSQAKTGDSSTETSVTQSPDPLIKPSLSPKDKDIKDSLIKTLQSYGFSIWGNDMGPWWSLQRRLKESDVILSGDDTKIVVSGLSKELGNFTEAEVMTSRFSLYFKRAGLDLEFRP